MKIIINDNTITDMSPELLAEAFWNMESGDKSMFFNHLGIVSESALINELKLTANDDELSDAGRRVMQNIGEYSPRVLK